MNAARQFDIKLYCYALRVNFRISFGIPARIKRVDFG